MDVNKRKSAIPVTDSASWNALQQKTIQTRIVLLLAAMLLAATIAGVLWYRENRYHMFRLRENYQAEKQEFVHQIVDLKSTRLRGYVVENTYWDEAVTFLKKGNQKWAETSLDTPAQTVGASALWLFRRDGSVAHSWHVPGLVSVCPDNKDFGPALHRLPSARILRWFVWVGSVVWEMHGATLHPSNDPQHRGEFYGYLIAGRPCNQAYLNEIGKVAHCHLSKPKALVAGTSKKKAFSFFIPPSNQSSDLSWVSVSIPLPDLYGSPTALLQGTAENPLAPAIEQATRQAITIFGIFACSILGLTLWVLTRWLNAPIRLLTDALLHHAPERLTPLLSERTEFGVLASFIAAFFRQEHSLRESHEELEQRVATRTAELAHRAYHDTLTGLPNRALFSESLDAALNRTQLFDQSLAVLFIDLDNFKVVNDSLGHEIGDGLLGAAAQRMQQGIHPPAMVARLGGDEFAILLEETSDSEVRAVAEHLGKVLRAPFLVAGRTLCTTASIGIALGSRESKPGDLLRNADIAMYHTKARGRGSNYLCYTMFDAAMGHQANERLEMEAAMRNALPRLGEEFGIVFQPIYDLKTQRISGMEALMRWQHPTEGAIAPRDFIPLAEETGLIHELTDWVLREACHGYSHLMRYLPPISQPRFVSVNFSSVCLQSKGASDRILQCIAEEGLVPTQLALEITESVIARQSVTILEVLRDLRAAGVRILMDDFGTGYSSMASLMDLPVDVIKIDQAFVGVLEERPETQAILRAMVALADALHMDVICEGIERNKQCDILTHMGEIYGQGFLLASPLPLEELARFLKVEERFALR